MSTISDANNVAAERLANMPDDGRRRELVNGVLKMMSPAGGRHGLVALCLGRLLGNHVEIDRLGVVFAAETGFILSRNPDTVRAPDVAFVRQNRLNSFFEFNWVDIRSASRAFHGCLLPVTLDKQPTTAH